MASLATDKNGNKTIQFKAANRRRKTIRLGPVPLAMAKSVKFRVEILAAAAITGHAIDDGTARWLNEIDGILRDKLVAVGLVAEREAVTVGELLDLYDKARPDVKRATKIVYGHTMRCLREFLGNSKPLRDVTPADAEAWRIWLEQNQKLSLSTARRRAGIAKQFFRWAVRKRLVEESPFADLKSGDQVNDSKDYFITRADAQKVLDACNSDEWQMIFALSRFGGLRCPSEHLGLRWGDIDWARNRITVHSPKTEHHAGGASRVIPLFPELRVLLERMFDQAAPGTEFVITKSREPGVNWRTTLLKIIARAGLKPWPKLFANLRATRATELAGQFPGHVAAEWLGHSTLIAQKHYWQTTDTDFEKAAATPLDSALQNPVQPGCDNPGLSTPARASRSAEASKNKEDFAPSRTLAHLGKTPLMGGGGLEPTTSTV
ncbi:tyrosine-type recombinase/integrase [Anatilimnocola aggregata]|nr:tyrosine-type recombinase/integrase [Anatilimnocola aggregata]